MSVPYLSYVDSATRKLANCIAETQGINQRKKQVTLKVKFLQVAPFTGKEYPKYLRYKKNNKSYVLKKIKVPMPSRELYEPYEIKKADFNKGLRTRLVNMLDKVEQKEKRQNTRGLKEGSMQFDIWTIATTTKWKTFEDIRQELNKRYEREVNQGQFSRNIISMRKNGYDVIEYRGK